MTLPEGNLTPAQFEIVDIVWNHGRSGASVAEVWRGISQTRDVARTTVLKLVDRLERRGWLKRRRGKGVNRFVATLSREKTARLLAGEFVDEFFGGSASELVMSLLGSKRLGPDEVQRLQQLLKSKATETKSPAKGPGKERQNDH